MAKPVVDPFTALTATEARAKKCTLARALSTMDPDAAAEWQAIVEGTTLNPTTGQPYSIDHIVRAFDHVGHNVSPAAVHRWRKRR